MGGGAAMDLGAGGAAGGLGAQGGSLAPVAGGTQHGKPGMIPKPSPVAGLMKGIGEGLMKDSVGAYDRFASMRTPGLTMAQGGPVSSLFEEDGFVPGEAEVGGDDEQNDIVPSLLSPGEVVIPRSIAQSPNAPEEAASFVAHLMRRQGREDDGFGRVLQARRQYADGGAVQDPENFRRRTLPADEPMGEKRSAAIPGGGLLPVYTGDSAQARAEAEVKRAKMKITPERLAEGGEVSSEPDFAEKVRGWWASLKAPTTEEVLEGANEALPDSLSAREAVLKKRAQLQRLDEQTRN
jgi:hypothetical protein